MSIYYQDENKEAETIRKYKELLTNLNLDLVAFTEGVVKHLGKEFPKELF